MILNEIEIDTLSETLQIGAGVAAAALSELLGERIDLSIPSARVCSMEEIHRHFQHCIEPLKTSVSQEFRGGLRGRAFLAFPHRASVQLGQLVCGLQSAESELTEDLVGALEEVGNIVLNGVLGSISNMTGSALSYSVPRLSTGMAIEHALKLLANHSLGSDQQLVLADVQFGITQEKISATLLLVLEIGSLAAILN